MQFRINQKTAPASEPLTTAEAKTHLNVSSADDDTYIDLLISAARQHAEYVTRRALITQTWNQYLDAFEPTITLYKPPLQSVVSIKYIDVAGVEQTLSAGTYTVDTDAAPGLVYPAYNETWPTTQAVAKAVNIEYIAGYGDAAAVPLGIKHAILLLVGHLYEHRETVSDFQVHNVPMGFDELLWPYRVPSL